MTTMLSVITALRPYAEFLYFIAGILLVAGVALAYQQLKAVKKDSSLRIKRAAKEKAIEACERFYSVYVPLADKFFILREDQTLGTYDGIIGDFSKGSLAADELPQTLLRFSTKTWGNHLNQLEVIAAVLTVGVGDEETAFDVIGRSFCSAIEEHYDLISFCRSEASVPYFHNSVELYRIWNPRIQKATLSHTKKGIDARLNTMPDRRLPPIEERSA